MVTPPTAQAEDYMVEDAVDAKPKHGTTVQSGWAAAESFLKAKDKDSKYAANFKFSEEATLVRFLEDEPFMVYEEHWIDRTEGRRSFVSLGDDDPLTIIAGSKPRPKFAFNVLVLSEEEPNVQIMTVPITLARLLQAANEDPRRGPLTKFYWTLARLGTGRDTQYQLERVRATDLAEEWELDPEKIDEIAKNALRYDDSAISRTSYEEHLKVAREVVSA